MDKTVQMEEDLKRSLDALLATVKAQDAPARAMGAAMIRMGAFMMASCNIDGEAFLKYCRSQFGDAERHNTTRPPDAPLH